MGENQNQLFPMMLKVFNFNLKKESHSSTTYQWNYNLGNTNF